MKKEKDRQVGVRVGLPVFFALELEDVYRHTEGAHRALAFPDFIGLLVGMGLDAYRKQNAAPIGKAAEAIEESKAESRAAPLRLFDINPGRLPELAEDKPFNFIGPEDWNE